MAKKASKKAPLVQVVYRDASGRFTKVVPKGGKKAPAKKAAAKKKVPTRSLNRAARYEALAKTAQASAKRAKSPKRRAIQTVRAGALALKAKAFRGELTKEEKALAKAYGIMRANPAGLMRDLKALLMPTLVAGSSAWVVHRVGSMVRESSAKSATKFVQTYGPTLATGGATMGAYLLARMVSPRHASAVLFGGVAATVVQALVDTKSEEGRSVGNRLFPQALQGYVSLAGVPSAEMVGSPAAYAIEGVPSVEDFASPSSMQILRKDSAGSLSGSIFD